MVKNINMLVLFVLLWLSSTSVRAFGNEYPNIGVGSNHYQLWRCASASEYPDVLDRNGFESNSFSLNDKDEIDKVDWLDIGGIVLGEIVLAG